ncbi:uncharacterized protein LOC110858254 [Folsomia candida]|uniref:Uncharacterized protein n=1 Tax=Folsomia candida TaxID=158441 RepID=A0A226DID0_FOLCA|nr:uncharacterized protein LOC110858254 [Folsomia candida]OXA43946.1 hypothetical protein Fcan01_21333 [Folsomia candida]
MKYIFSIFLVVQLSLFAASMAQITFTREWVTGKRSAAPKLRVLMHDDNICKSLLPAIDYLLEVEKIHQKLCGPPPKSYSVPVMLKKLTPVSDVLSSSSSGDQGYDDGYDGVASSHMQKST